MKRAAIRLAYLLGYYSGFMQLLMWLNKRPVVVTYHNIISDSLYDNNAHLSLTHKASIFDRQIAIIKGKYSISRELEPGKLTITFDDGYENNLSVALPILRKHAAPATFFVPASYFESKGILWVDRLLMWLAHVPMGRYEVMGQVFSISNGADRKSALDRLWEVILEDYSKKSDLLNELEQVYSYSRLAIDEKFLGERYQPLKAEDIEAIKEAGYNVACHSYAHDILTRLSDAQLDEDFRRCEGYRSRYNSSWYGYPFGRPAEVDARVVEKCRQYRYSKAFINQNTKSDAEFQIPRINMPDTDDKVLIYAKLSGFESMLKSVLPG